MKYGLTIALFLVVGIAAVYAAEPIPTFKPGLWKFTRTVESRPEHNKLLPNATVVARQVVERCVDPSDAMRGIFANEAHGLCRPLPVEYRGTYRGIAHRWVFPKRCDYMGIARTNIYALGREAYVEVEEYSHGRLVKDTVQAQRLRDCESVQKASTQ